MSADAECDAKGLTLAAFTVPDCMNVTAEQKHFINYPWNKCIYDAKSQSFAKILGTTTQ